MLIDSHCHLNFPELKQNLNQVLQRMQEKDVRMALNISVSKSTFEDVLEIANSHPNIYATVGVHPDDPKTPEFSLDELIKHAALPKVVGIGETGLDYHWCQGDLTWQKNRFITHIQAALATGLPLVVHTREAPEDTLDLLRTEKAEKAVIHCFTENKDFAKKVLDLGYYISFSGIVTFKNAKDIHEAAQYVPLDRLLIETDAPFLAPVPFRGKSNEPAFVRYVAEHIANLRNISFDEVAKASTDNFFRLFDKVPSLS